MDNALARPANSLSAQTVDSFGGRLAALPMSRKLTMGVGALALAGAIWALVAWNTTGDYKVLYANLSDKDGGAVTAQLSTMNVPYKFSEGGGAILVPAAQVHDLRLKMASAGLPKGSVVGFELMENARFGLTQFQERLNFQRGLEGELTRSIQALAAVESARVHLALPNQNGFFREQQKPSASVLLTLHAGRTLDRSQMAGIIHLVASSVPELDPKAVSVLDQTGSLLSGSPETNGSGLDAQQLQYVNQIEQSYSKRVLALLEPVVGRENLRAQVTADVDFSQSEATSEEFKPNQNNQQASIRSQQSTEQSGGTNGSPPSGIPGAASNQPATPATAPINGAAQPLQTAQGGGSGGSSTSRREAVTNYEVDKTVRVTRNATGTVKRLNAAVVVNNRTTTDPKGKVTQVPLTDAELEKLTALVQESIGFNKTRGDSVKVINAPFQVDTTTTPDVPLWKQPETLDMIRTVLVPGSLTLLALVIVFSMIRPSLKAAMKPAETEAAKQLGNSLDAVVSDNETLPDGSMNSPLALPAPKGIEHLASARKMAKDNPAQVAGILRNWVAAE
ncbi:flagellar basal-body MS-ring/collar protein FliF [soil metagenome]